MSTICSLLGVHGHGSLCLVQLQSGLFEHSTACLRLNVENRMKIASELLLFNLNPKLSFEQDFQHCYSFLIRNDIVIQC